MPLKAGRLILLLMLCSILCASLFSTPLEEEMGDMLEVQNSITGEFLFAVISKKVLPLSPEAGRFTVISELAVSSAFYPVYNLYTKNITEAAMDNMEAIYADKFMTPLLNIGSCFSLPFNVSLAVNLSFFSPDIPFKVLDLSLFKINGSFYYQFLEENSHQVGLTTGVGITWTEGNLTQSLNALDAGEGTFAGQLQTVFEALYVNGEVIIHKKILALTCYGRLECYHGLTLNIHSTLQGGEQSLNTQSYPDTNGFLLCGGLELDFLIFTVYVEVGRDWGRSVLLANGGVRFFL